MDNTLADAARELAADNLFELVRRNYTAANHEYLQKQIAIASEWLTEDQKEYLRVMGWVV